MKQLKRWSIPLLCVMLLVAAAAYVTSESSQEDVLKCWKENKKSCMKIAEELLNNGSVEEQEEMPKGIKEANLWNHRQVDFTCYYKGFGSTAKVKGFYYSKDDEARGYQGASLTFEKEGRGLKWTQEEGDNWCYVEKLEDNWYYFEVSF